MNTRERRRGWSMNPDSRRVGLVRKHTSVNMTTEFAFCLNLSLLVDYYTLWNNNHPHSLINTRNLSFKDQNSINMAPFCLSSIAHRYLCQKGRFKSASCIFKHSLLWFCVHSFTENKVETNVLQCPDVLSYNMYVNMDLPVCLRIKKSISCPYAGV